jgi:SpoVK/Ycf46/Vps4 family AAA+-type ATPase
MPDPQSESIQREFRQALADCEELYRSAAQQCLENHPESTGDSPQALFELFDDLNKGLVAKIYSTVAQADRRWSREEARIAGIMYECLWKKRLEGDSLREATLQIFQQSDRLRWYSLVRPFEQIPALRERADEVETVAIRLANLIAKCDGTVTDSEAALLRTIEAEIRSHLRPLALAVTDEDEVESASAQAVREIGAELSARQAGPPTTAAAKPKPPPDKRPPSERLQEALNDLSHLVGLDGIKREVATLTNVLKLHQKRFAAGLPTTEMGLHMVFTGNPGTGKTSVARIIGRILGAMGILPSGHLVETDRAGLIAQYAGQTAPKTNKKIDEALGGVLFIDEAYSLVSESGDDAYGHEAIQTLLKRMEDDRQRLVVILAGYPQPMNALLRSNPGLHSRFNTSLTFDDYRPSELGRIFQSLADKSRYTVPGPTQARLLLGFRWIFAHRDEHFGNGRTARNVFEQAIRRLANRISGITPVTHELLTIIQPVDIEFSNVPQGQLDEALDDSQRFLITCPGCNGKSPVRPSQLGLAVKCKSCNTRFICAWGEPL